MRPHEAAEARVGDVLQILIYVINIILNTFAGPHGVHRFNAVRKNLFQEDIYIRTSVH
jgi:hypothetical protein